MALAREAIRLNTTVYGSVSGSPPTGLERLILPNLDRTVIQHEVPLSIYWPTKDLGPKPFTVSGRIFLNESAVHAFITDVANPGLYSGQTERKLHWMDSGVEVYAWVKAGTTTREQVSEGGGSYYQWVSFSFQSTRTTIHKSSDDSILLGGS